ncbi:ATP-binding protein [Catenovulum sp. 2E275]|uniref:sensor histidine kinase n=1 Tax=Catenovulum sp. 2E275 TaxID=2980497 RepID=UPI0021D08F4C|nr:ATP-binding protein [Catenovulum sp. 2E275]MCU4675130.1 ATP-binding protein [Catenovulum sp. 2E275]
MKIVKTPSWVIILICFLIGCFASFKAKQQLAKFEETIWLNSASEANQAFANKLTILFNNKIEYLPDFLSYVVSQPDLNKAGLDKFAESYLIHHPATDEISLGYYQIIDNRLSHQWSFGTARSYQSDDTLKSELFSLFRLAKATPDTLLYQLTNPREFSEQNLLIGQYIEAPNQGFFIFGIIDLSTLNYQINKELVPDNLLINLSFLNHNQKNLFSWQYNEVIGNPDIVTLPPIYTSNWQISTQVIPKFKNGINSDKSNKILSAGIVLSMLIACFIIFLAWLRHLVKLDLKAVQAELIESMTQKNIAQENLKRSAKLSVYSQLAPKAIHSIPPYISNVIKACSSLEEKGIHLKNLIKEKKATKTQYLSYLENTVLLARGSAENMLKAGESLYNLEKIKLELEQDPLRQIHLQTHIQELVDTYKNAHKNINFVITVAQDLIIQSYPGSLTHLLTIFLNNSLEHGFKNRNDKVLMIEATYNKKKDMINIRVEDNGLGIEPELLEAMLNQQPHPLCTGIGLSLAKEITEAQLGGELDIKSKYERYTRISLLLPKKINAEQNKGN